jgi:DNA modification methylase
MNEETETLAVTTDRYAIWNADTVEVATKLPSHSVDLLVTSIPFSSLYVYSASPRDMGNVRNDKEFFSHLDFLVREQARVMRPGRNVCVHCMQLPTSKERDGYIGLRDFRGDVIRAYEKHGFIYHSEICIWKDPVLAMQRTKALGLLHKQVRKDSAMSRQGIADYVVVMRAPGENATPIPHERVMQTFTAADGSGDAFDDVLLEPFPVEQWQRWASPVWACFNDLDTEGFLKMCNPSLDVDGNGIDMGDTLQATSAREHDDERHLAPLQLEVIRRCIRLWSNPGETVWDPFGGIGSTGYVALLEGRKTLMAELKTSYFRQMKLNLERAVDNTQIKLF